MHYLINEARLVKDLVSAARPLRDRVTHIRFDALDYRRAGAIKLFVVFFGLGIPGSLFGYETVRQIPPSQEFVPHDSVEKIRVSKIAVDPKCALGRYGGKPPQVTCCYVGLFLGGSHPYWSLFKHQGPRDDFCISGIIRQRLSNIFFKTEFGQFKNRAPLILDKKQDSAIRWDWTRWHGVSDNNFSRDFLVLSELERNDQRYWSFDGSGYDRNIASNDRQRIGRAPQETSENDEIKREAGDSKLSDFRVAKKFAPPIAFIPISFLSIISALYLIRLGYSQVEGGRWVGLPVLFGGVIFAWFGAFGFIVGPIGLNFLLHACGFTVQ